MDNSATNYDANAELSDGSCKYQPLILDGSFESIYNSPWLTYAGTGFSYAGATNAGDGFMPTEGQYFLKCLPSLGFQTLTRQYIGANQHYKGLYFDYSYTAKGGLTDSILYASISIYGTTWTKTISATPNTFGGFPNITVQKRDEYMDLPYTTNNNGLFSINTSLSKGAFTFEIDNIRLVQK